MTKLLIPVVLALVLGGCKPQERIVEVEKVVFKTDYRNTIQRDSVYMQDSIYIRERDDTVFVTQWKAAYRYKVLTDTIRISDSVYTEVPVLVRVPEIEYRQTGIQKMLSRTGAISLLIALAFGIFKIIKWKFKL